MIGDKPDDENPLNHPPAAVYFMVRMRKRHTNKSAGAFVKTFSAEILYLERIERMFDCWEKGLLIFLEV